MLSIFVRRVKFRGDFDHLILYKWKETERLNFNLFGKDVAWAKPMFQLTVKRF